jgi:hypothetical protein
VAPQRNAAAVGFSATTTLAAATQLYLRYGGEIGSGTDNHALNVGVRFGMVTASLSMPAGGRTDGILPTARKAQGFSSPGRGGSPPLRFMIRLNAAKSARPRRSAKNAAVFMTASFSATAVATN